MAKQQVLVELFYNAVWNDHTDATLVRDQISITRGRQNESSQPAPTTCELTFSGWRFNPDNPTSDLSGLIGRNTPLRVTVGTSVRFVGQVASWTPRQSLGGPNIPPDRWVEVEAAGITRRLGQGADPLRSALGRLIPTSPNVVAYWPLDAGQLATVSEPEVGTGQFRALSGRTRFGVGDLHPWLEPGLAFEENATMRGDVSMTTTPTVFTVRFVIRRDSTGGPAVLHTVGNTQDGGNTFIVTLTPPDTVEIQLNHDGSFVDSGTGSFPGLFDGKPHLVQLGAGPSDASGSVSVDGVGVVDAFVDGMLNPLTGCSQVRVSYNPGTGGNPMAIGHLAVWDGPSLTADQLAAYQGYAGEHAGDRIDRLAGEEGIAVLFGGTPADTVPLGPQYPDGLLAILREAAAVDDGVLLDRRDDAGLHYRTGRFRYNQDPALELDYDAAQVGPPLDPKVLDDQSFRNDVTAKRRDGGQARAVDQDSVDAVGRTTSSVTVNVMGDGMLGDQAGWRLHLGTVAGTRFPQISVDLDASPELVADVDFTFVSDRITIVNLPSELTPDLANLLVLAWTETIGSHRRRITYNTTPEGPYHILEIGHPTLATLGSTSAVVDEVGGLDTTETGVTVRNGAGPDWVHEVDYDITIGGERMTVTAVGSPTGTFPNRLQQLTVTRSVNGVVKSHPDGAPVAMFDPAYIGL